MTVTFYIDGWIFYDYLMTTRHDTSHLRITTMKGAALTADEDIYAVRLSARSCFSFCASFCLYPNFFSVVYSYMYSAVLALLGILVDAVPCEAAFDTQHPNHRGRYGRVCAGAWQCLDSRAALRSQALSQETRSACLLSLPFFFFFLFPTCTSRVAVVLFSRLQAALTCVRRRPRKTLYDES